MEFRPPPDRQMEPLDLKDIENLLDNDTVPLEPEEKEPEGWREKLKLVIPHIGLVVVTLVYATLGAVLFYNVESPFEMESKQKSIATILSLKRDLIGRMWNSSRTGLRKEEWLQQSMDSLRTLTDALYEASDQAYLTFEDLKHNETSGGVWTFPSSFFFSMTTMATIGYGNILPVTTSGRVACIFFALVGMPLAIVTIGDLGKFLSELTIWLYKRYKHIKTRLLLAWATRKFRQPNGLQTRTRMGPGQPDLEPEDDLEDLLIDKRQVPVFMVFAILVSYISFGAFIFSAIEGWQYGDSFYFCFITLTTVGFGDMVPRKHRYMAVMVIYISLGLAVTTMCIDLVGIHYIEKIHNFGRKLKGTDLLEMLRRRKQLQRQLALAHKAAVMELWMSHQGETKLSSPDDLMQINSMTLTPISMSSPSEPVWPTVEPQVEVMMATESIKTPESSMSLPSASIHTASSVYERERIYDPAKSESCSSWGESGPDVSLECSIGTNSTYYERMRQHGITPRSKASWIASGPDISYPCSVGTNSSYCERLRQYSGGWRYHSDNSWLESGPDISQSCSIATNSSYYERMRTLRKRANSDSSWIESGPDVSIHCSLSTTSSVHERMRVANNIQTPPSWSESEDFLIDWVSPPISPDYEAIAKAARSKRICSCPGDYCKHFPEEPYGLFMMEDWDSFKEMEEASLRAISVIPDIEVCSAPDLSESPEEPEDSDDEQNPPSLLSPLDIEVDVVSSTSTPITSPAESFLDFGDAEAVEVAPSDSGMSTETEPEESVMRDQPVAYHKSLPVFSVEQKAVDSTQAVANALRCPDSCLSTETPRMVTENYCFVLDGNKVNLADVTAGDQWWRPTGHPTKYYHSEDLKTFQKVQILLIRGKAISAKLVKSSRQHQFGGSTEQLTGAGGMSPSTMRRDTSTFSFKNQPDSTGHLSVASAKGKAGRSPETGGKFRDRRDSSEERRDSIGQATHLGGEKTSEEVPLTKVYKVTRFYSFWKTCTGFHRIVTVIAPVAGTGKELKKRIFVQYLWREASEADKARITREFSPKGKKHSAKQLPPSDPATRRRAFNF